MGQYKVPQNVEAEDKIIGALTLKQFIYAVIGVMIGLVSFLTLRKAPVVMLIVGLPPTALFLLLGLYQRKDQPFEALFLSLVSFMAKPRKRLWIKEPIEEVFKIEAPKVVKAVTQRDPREVRGQLEQLSQVVDTRGWGSKKAELQEPGEAPILETEGRLATPELSTDTEPIESDISMADDILDVQNNPTAQNVGALMQDQAKTIREEAIERLRRVVHEQPAQPTPTPAPSQPAAVVPPQIPEVTRVGSSELTTDATVMPRSVEPAAPVVPTASAAKVSTAEMTTNPLDDILKLAMENDDLPVSRIADQAHRQQAMAEGQAVSLRENGNT